RIRCTSRARRVRGVRTAVRGMGSSLRTARRVATAGAPVCSSDPSGPAGAAGSTVATMADVWGDYEIGPLRGADVEELAAAHCRIWQVTYADLMSAEALARLTPEAFVHGWTDRAQLVEQGEDLPDGERVEIARSAGVPVGFSSVGDPRGDDAPAP